jgi:hypothetical protein
VNDGGIDVDSTVFWRRCCVGTRCSGRVFWLVAEKIVAGGARLGFALGEIGGVAVVLQAHVTVVEATESIGMGSTIVQEIGDGLGGGFALVLRWIRVC